MYFASNTRHCGKAKLFKLLHLLDFTHFRETGRSVTEPPAVLRFLMEQHGLRRADLAEIFGSQSNVNEALINKRAIGARQARALPDRFSVSPAVFV